MGLVLLIVLVILLLGGLPVHPWAAAWGYGPAGVIGVVLVIVLLLVLLGRL